MSYDEIPTAPDGEEYIFIMKKGYIDGDPWKFTHGKYSNGFVASLINCKKKSKCNCKFTVNKKDKSPELMKSIKVVTTEDVSKGEQLFVGYGGSYFPGKPTLNLTE